MTEPQIYCNDTPLVIRAMRESDVALLVHGFAEQGWHKPAEQFELYLAEQKLGKREVVIAEMCGEVAGYVTLLPEKNAGPFAGLHLPEICDFNVLMKFQRRGIGEKLMDTAEMLAAERADTVTLAVGLHSGYGAAQRMYAKRRYIPDGTGCWYRDENLPQYSPCVNDDDLVFYMSKKLC